MARPTAPLRVSTPNFPRAFRAARVATGVAQDGIEPAAGRAYVSQVESGKYAPTLAKIDAMVRQLNLHPLTVLTMTYMDLPTPENLTALQAIVKTELKALGLTHFSPEVLTGGRKPAATSRSRTNS